MILWMHVENDISIRTRAEGASVLAVCVHSGAQRYADSNGGAGGRGGRTTRYRLMAALKSASLEEGL